MHISLNLSANMIVLKSLKATSSRSVTQRPQFVVPFNGWTLRQNKCNTGEYFDLAPVEGQTTLYLGKPLETKPY